MEPVIIRAGDVRTTTTPNGVMTTLASPTLSGSTGASLWRVAIPAGGSGPVHAFDSQQVWTLLSGTATFTVDGVGHRLEAGDTIQLPAGAQRQLHAALDVEFVVTGEGTATVTAAGNAASGSTPPWIA
jgi:quercetin dioxygenase-like cupin family protein